MKQIVNLKAQLAREFLIKDLGLAKKILEMRISRGGKNTVEFSMKDFKLSKVHEPKTEDGKVLMSKVTYASVVGNLMYVMICTRPDIAYAVGVVSRYMSNPAQEHWRVVKWIMRYLKGSSDLVLCYGRTNIRLHGYVDSYFVGNVDSRKSTTGYVFTSKSGAISWVSRLQKIVALSTTELNMLQ